MHPDDDLMSVSDAAQLAGVHPQTVRRWIDEGRLSSVNIYPTNRVRVRREDIEAAKAPRDPHK